MKASLHLEYIGESNDAKARLYFGIVQEMLGRVVAETVVGRNPFTRKPWVAKITGFDFKYGYKREFINGKIQRLRSNAAGSRGIEIWFLLESGFVYQARHFTSWKSEEKFFCKVTEDGDIEKISQEEVDEWLRKKALE